LEFEQKDGFLELGIFRDHLWVWLIAAFSVISLLAGKLLTNRHLKKHRDSILVSGTMPTVGFVPAWISVLYMLGLVGLILSGFFAFTLRWWAPGLVVCLYFVIDRLIPSQIEAVTSQLKTDGPFKKCSRCGTIRNTSYFSLDDSSSDGLGNLCVACIDPETWAMIQDLKSASGNQ
jgi:hypothetical protein